MQRRFTGLRAKQQRKLAAAIKVSRQMALLPYTSRYPMPSPAQMQVMTDEAMARINWSQLENAVDDIENEHFDE